MAQISFHEFKKLDIRVGRVMTAELVPGTDKLIHLTVAVGQDEVRHIVAGLKDYYQPEEIQGKQIVVLLNIEPRRMRGIVSNGMLLAASTDDMSSVRLLTVDGELPPGSKIS